MQVNAIDLSSTNIDLSSTNIDSSSTNAQISTNEMSLKQKEHIELYSLEKGFIGSEPIEIIIKIKCPDHQKAEIKNKIINAGIQNCVYVFE